MNNQNKHEESNIHLLRYLEKKQEVSQRDMAKHLGISLGKVNFILKALLQKGIIKARNFKNNKNKSAYAYYLTRKGISEKARLMISFFDRKSTEYDKLKRELIELEKEVKVAKDKLSDQINEDE